MSPDPDQLTEYKFKQLFEGLGRLEAAMRDGFAELKRILDERLESRDERIEKVEGRVTALEQWRARREGQLVILGAIGGVLLTLALGTLWTVLT